MSDESTESRLGELLLRWEELQERGESVAPEALCADHPELVGELARRIAALRGFDPAMASEKPSSGDTMREPDPSQVALHSVRREKAVCRADYHDLRFHAGGGLGEVYTAKSTDLNRDVALKFIKAAYTRDAECLRRFLLEAEVTGRLEHPGVVPVYGLGVDEDGQPCYAMRLIRGETFQDAIDAYHVKTAPARGPDGRVMEFRGLLRRFVSICNTIAYAHSRGMLHRDIKPRNVMLGKYEETLVVDWGLARPFEKEGGAEVVREETLRPSSGASGSGTPTAGPVGTPQYMSPEQAEGWPIGPAADIYSLGATLYALLAGASPFPGRHVGQILVQVRRGEFPPPRQVKPGVPAALEAVCLKAMSLEPEDRYATALDLAADVERWLADEPVSAYTEPLVKRLGRWARRHRTVVVGASSAVLVAAISFAVATILLAAANERERTAKNSVALERDEAERQKAQALESFRLALKAVDRFYIRISEDKLLNVPGLQKLRRELLQTSLDFYDQLAKNYPDNPDLRAETGKAFSRLALVTLSVGSNPKADELNLRALAVLEPVATAPGARPVDRRDFGSALHNQGFIAAALGKHDEAQRHYEHALEVLQSLATGRPNDLETLYELAKARNDLAGFHSGAGRRGEAEGLYKENVKVVDRLIAGDPKSLPYQSMKADGIYNFGLIYRDTGRTAEAEAAFRAAVEARERLANENPTSLRLRRSLVFSHGELGGLYALALDQPAKAEASFREALRHAEKLAADNPDASEYRCDLAIVLNNLAQVYPRPAEAKKARPLYERALALRQKLVQDDPARVEFQADLAANLINLGQIDQDLGKHADAESKHRDAVKILEALVRDHPGVQEASIRLGAAYAGLANVFSVRYDHGAAIEWSDRSIETLDRVLKQSPDFAVAKMHLGHALWSRAASHYWLGRYVKARADFDRAFGLLSGPPRELVRLGRDEASAHLGDYAGAVADAEALPRKGLPAGESALELACVYAAASSAALEDSRLSPHERRATSERYASRAVELLREAAATGYFAAPQAREMLTKHPDFSPLRSRDDFKRLEADLHAPVIP